MYWRDHNPPHFHAKYGEFEVLIDIKGQRVLEGGLPRRALGHVLEWTGKHQQELLENWELCRNRQRPNSVLPLE